MEISDIAVSIEQAETAPHVIVAQHKDGVPQKPYFYYANLVVAAQFHTAHQPYTVKTPAGNYALTHKHLEQVAQQYVPKSIRVQAGL